MKTLEQTTSAPKNKEVKPLFFLKGFESNQPDVFHKVDYDFMREELRGKLVLNAGCWTGNFETLIPGNHCRLIGLDINEQALKIARRGSPDKHFVRGDILRFPFREGRFDVVTFFATLEHIPDRTEIPVLTELGKMLRPGGKLVLTTPHSYWLGNILDVPHWLTNHRHYRLKEIKHFARAAGFEVERLELRGRFWSELANFMFYPCKFFLRINVFRLGFVQKLIQREYQKPGYRMIYLVARKKQR